MSSKGIEAVLSRAMSDPKFADVLFTDAEKALVDFDLTAGEVLAFKSMARVDFDKLMQAPPEERKSFGITVDQRGGWDRNHNELLI
jgi:hypothetical protein